MKPLKITKKDKFWHVRYKVPEHFDEFRTSKWAQKVAASVSQGAKVTTAHLKEGTNWKIMLSVDEAKEEK